MKKILIVFALFFIIQNNLFAQEVMQGEEINLFDNAPVMTHASVAQKAVVAAVPQEAKPVQNVVEKPLAVDSVFAAKVVADIPTLQKLTLPQAIDYAIKHNLAMQSTRLDVNKAKNDIKAAGRFQNPSMYNFLNSGKAATDNPDQFGFVQPIEIAKRGPRKRLAQANFELTKGNVELREFYLRLDVRQTYVDLVAAKTTLKIMEEQKKLLEELYCVAKRKFEVGTAPEMDVIQAKMAFDLLITQVNNARTAVDVARYNFNKALGSDNNFDTAEDYLPDQKDFIFLLTPKPQDKMPEFMKVANVAADKRLDLKNAKQEVEVARKNLVVVTRQRVPDFEIGGGAMYCPDGLTTAEGANYGYYVVGNITNIPLFYRYTPEIKNAALEVDQKALQYNNLRHVAMMDLNSTYEQFVTAQTNLNFYNDALLVESKRFLGMAKKSYEIGKTSITDFIFIQQSYRSILMGYTNSLATYYDSWVDFLREVNDEEIKLDEK